MRQKQDAESECDIYSILVNNKKVKLINSKEASNRYCFDEFSENPTSTIFNTINNSILTDYLTYQNICENGTIFPDDICYTIPGYFYRTLDKPYTFNGEITSYSMSNGYYFDLPVNNSMNYSKIIDFLQYYWWDLSSRLLVISFNAFQEDTNIETDNPRIINLR